MSPHNRLRRLGPNLMPIKLLSGRLPVPAKTENEQNNRGSEENGEYRA